MGEHDEVPGEPVAADMGALPRGGLVQLLADSLPQRAPVPRAAAVVLPVRADEKERLVERPGRFERVDPAQLLVFLELEAGEPFVPGSRVGHVGRDAFVMAPVRTADEQESRARTGCDEFAKPRLDLVREPAAC